VGLILGLATLALGWAALEWSRGEIRDREQGAMASLAGAGARLTEDWLSGGHQTGALLAQQAAALLDAGGPDALRAMLSAALSSHPESLRAAVLADAEGRVLAAASSWREGSRPAWVPEPTGEAARWVPAEEAGWFVAQEALAATGEGTAGLRLVTAWDPSDLARRLEAILDTAPRGAALSVEAMEGAVVLELPARGAGGAGPEITALRAVEGAGVRVRGSLRGWAPALPWPPLAAAAVALVGGLLAAWSAARDRRLVLQLEEAAGRAVAGEPGADEAVARRLPGLARTLDEHAQRTATESRGQRSVRDALARLRGGLVLVSDAAGTVEYVGGDAAPFFGRPSADLKGATLRRVFAGPAFETLAAALTRSTPGAAGETLELEPGRARDGAGPLEVTVAARERGAGHVLLVRQPDAARRPAADEQEQHGLVDLLGDGLAVVRDGRVERANPALASLLGLAPEEMVGAELRSHVAPEDVLLVAHRLRSLPRAGARFDLKLRRSDSLEPVEASVAAIPLGDDEGCLLAVSDRTQALRGERQLLEAHRRLDATLDSTSDGLLAVKVVEGRPVIIVANRSFGEMFGLDLDDLIGREEEEVLGRLIETHRLPEGFAPWARELGRHPGTRRSGRFEVSAGGERRVLEVQATPLFLPGQQLPGRVIAFRDVTAQSEVERRLREDQEASQARRQVLEEANRELERVNQELAGRAAELDKANQALKRIDDKRSKLLAEVTHELQTPLVSIRGFTEMILRQRVGPVTPVQERGLQISLKNIDRLIGLIDNLLDFIRAEGDLPELELSNFRLDELVAEVFDLLQPEAEKKDVRLEVSYGGGRPVVRADRGQVQQVFINLIGNAIKFSPEGREVVVEVAPSYRGFAQLIVKDMGPGIPAEDLQRVFERGYRVQRPEADRPAGSGLGLHITRQILRMHGCTIKASSPEDGGAMLQFTLPLAREGAPADPPASVRRRQSSERSET
jgi:PAS domain S-box-containing protein